MTTINIKKDALCGTIPIPAGDYSVSLRSDTRQINLAGHGRDIEINAIGRRGRGVQRSQEIQFSPAGGGNIWSLVVKTPKMGEYVATIVSDSADKRR